MKGFTSLSRYPETLRAVIILGSGCCYKKGFTLIELLVVVLIIGVLSAVALPQYQKAVEKSRASEALAVVKAIREANEIYYMSNGTYSANLNDLDIVIPGKDGFYNNIPRKESRLFSYGAKASLSSGGEAVALANRLPENSSYIIFAVANDNKLRCRFYSAKGEELCKLLGRKESNLIYVIN